MRIVFLDTVGLIALWDTSDQWHEPASVAYETLKRSPFIAVTSPFVLLECANAAVRRPYRSMLTTLRDSLAKDNLIVVPGDDEVESAWKSYEAGKAGSASVIDLISFSIMRRLGSTEVFSNDRHFKAAGFTSLF